MSPDEAHSIVVEGRAYTKEHFPGGRPGVFVGHVEADTFDQAVDRLAEDWGKLLAETEALQAFKGLVEDALFLRMYGERPPGAPADPAAETWRTWDTRAETALRALSD